MHFCRHLVMSMMEEKYGTSFQDVTELNQATQFLHENGLLLIMYIVQLLYIVGVCIYSMFVVNFSIYDVIDYFIS